jgi:hypothetical protein
MVDMKEKAEPVRICKRLRSPGIDSARLGIDSWAPKKVYKFGQGLEYSRIADEFRQKGAKRSNTRKVLKEILPCRKQCPGSPEC